MGLAVCVAMLDQVRESDDEGYAYYQEQFAQLSALLVAEGHARYREPEHVAVELPAHVGSFPYSYLHYLRRAFAHVRGGSTSITPCSEDEDPSRDPLLDHELSCRMESHLVCHSDAEGYYLPVDFNDVLYPDDALDIPGGMVGSSQRLLQELLLVAPALGVELVDGRVSEAAARVLSEEQDESHPLWIERMVWWALYVNAVASVKHNTAIVFC